MSKEPIVHFPYYLFKSIKLEASDDFFDKSNNTIVIAFKGAIRESLQSPHCAAYRLQHVRSRGPGTIVCKSCATHRALITCNTTYYVPDSSVIKFDTS